MKGGELIAPDNSKHWKILQIFSTRIVIILSDTKEPNSTMLIMLLEILLN